MGSRSTEARSCRRTRHPRCGRAVVGRGLRVALGGQPAGDAEGLPSPPEAENFERLMTTSVPGAVLAQPAWPAPARRVRRTNGPKRRNRGLDAAVVVRKRRMRQRQRSQSSIDESAVLFRRASRPLP